MQPNNILPGQTIGILGGGQLGRMMATAAKHMGYRIAVLDPTPDCPAAQIADHHVEAPYHDRNGIQLLADLSDVITYEFENVDVAAAHLLEKQNVLPQGYRLLEITQDRENEKKSMVANGLPVAPFSIVHNEKELHEAITKIEYPAVVKTCRGGYDGKGQMKLESEDDLLEAIVFVEKHGRCVLEKWLSFDKEVSVVFTRSHSGDITFFPLAENAHKDHILHTTIAPARVSAQVKEKVLAAARAIADGIDVIGTFAIEMFVHGEDIYMNEMAPRPHNSGHFTIECCNVSQFEQHIRAICGLPLIEIHSHGAACMVNLLGEDVEDYLARIQASTSGHIHVYGKKEIKPKRKMGHVTFIGASIADIQRDKQIFS
ncbi:5-(carboxyamino)imidazole ribonucleotide synthase [Aquibacillus sp. 3ASR75-11]|uniref:N5-carboxyaminoimidazole ribonucleotide synthase n=1 Tax=Terrihalobacillus insolitus TaxID=2950438 RepID=A0A9X4APC9_9BACI|nr:5-(carboxyamino)imidazole ribonucleotide synthase [Terrihalobacillus insolitus]MDC3414204.1 5-(carboxyamino)imidazole ribonucleotide synthase [Terrihalobacillus insolitus]MDC3425410.1 5-(carboxyamino)imidazole ribonucleotide synthase [Terrihalobacillus insolitus]